MIPACSKTVPCRKQFAATKHNTASRDQKDRTTDGTDKNPSFLFKIREIREIRGKKFSQSRAILTDCVATSTKIMAYVFAFALFVFFCGHPSPS
jgi:hypothetical protein